MPKIGPFKGMGFNNPAPQTADLYFKRINTTVDQYRAFLEEVRTDSLALPDRDLDSSNTTKAAEYSLADHRYASLLAQSSECRFEGTSPGLRDNILFYSGLSVPIKTEKDQPRSVGVLAALDQLKSVAPGPTVATGSGG
jgi:hypothetical protein